MPTVTLTFNNVPQSVIDILPAIATQAGFLSFKAMMRAYVAAEVRAYRGGQAVAGVREAAEAQADQETGGIT